MKAKPTNIKSFLVRMAMTLLMLVTMSQGASAADFITDVMVIGGTKSETNTLKDQYQSQGWIVIDYDLNKGVGGDYIYLLYKTASDEDPNATFITGFAYNNSPIDEMLLSDGRIYSLAPYDGGNDFKESKGNLNNNAGGIPLYLYYIKANSTDEQHVVKSITFNNDPEGATPEIDFNFGCEGAAEIYMHADITQGWTYRQISQTACTMSFEGPKAGIHSFNVPSTYKGLDVIAVSGLNGCVNLETLYFNSDSHVEQMPLLQDCSKLKNINILDSRDNSIISTNKTPPRMTKIPENAFVGTAVSTITLDEVTSVGAYAFEGCNLSSVIFNKSEVQIGNHAFGNISSECRVTYPGSMNDWSPYMYVYSPNLGVYASDGCCGWCGGADETTDNHLCWTLVNETGHLNIDWLWEGTLENQVINSHKWEPEKVKSITLNHVYAIGSYAFSGCSSLTSIDIPESVTNIGSYAFQNCSGLTSVTIGNGVTSIGEYTFSGCSRLASVTIPNSVTNIGSYAFQNCSGLTSITIGNGVTSIGNSAFSNCTALKSVTINSNAILSKNYSSSNSLNSIFGTQVTDYKIGNDVTSIGDWAFYNCSILTSVTIPNSVTSIGQYAFYDCPSLASVTIPNSVTKIENFVFYYCLNLTSVTIPNSVTSIGMQAFSYCSNLGSVTIPNSVTSIGMQAFQSCTSLASVTIGNSVTSIGAYAFSGCRGLTSIDIPNSVTSIGMYAFFGCYGLTSVIIGNGVTSIGIDAFRGCANMTDVYCYADPSALSWDDYGCNDFKPERQTICHVYDASDWSSFVDKVNVTFVGDLPYIDDNADNSIVLSKWNGKQLNMMLKDRTIHLDGDWNTLCLPFDVDSLNGTPLEGLTVKQLDTETACNGHKTGAENGTLYLNFKDASSITAGQPYIVKRNIDLVISSDADWNNFAQNVKSGTTYEGKVVGLGSDINVSTMAGTADCPFKGTFDGNGHTINVNLNGGGEALALFHVIDGATIQNVKVMGTVTSSNHRPATFAAFVEGNSTIKNCWSSVDIVSTRTSSWVDGGAFVARVSAGATLDMRDCAFIGTVTYHGGTSGGGMVGFTQTNATANLANCLFCPSVLTLTVNAYNPFIFVSGDERGNLTNCYYNDVAKDSPLTKEGIDASLMSTATLAAALGNNWEVSGNNAQPFCTSGIYNPIFGSVTIKNVAPAIVTSTDNAVSFTGSYNPVTASTPDLLYLGADNKLCYPSGSMSIGSCRACFHLPGGIGDNSMGDVNGDGQVSVNDVMAMVAYVLGVVNSGFIVENADLNGDGQISVNDVMALVKIILQGNQSISNIVINGADGITFGGGGTVPARAGEKQP